MKIFSGFFSLVLLLLALAFALSNRQSVTVSLWPFNAAIEAPLFLLTLGTLLVGFLLGAVIAWFAMLPHRLEARRMRRDINQLRDRLGELQQTILPPAQNMEAPTKVSFWKRRS